MQIWILQLGVYVYSSIEDEPVPPPLATADLSLLLQLRDIFFISACRRGRATEADPGEGGGGGGGGGWGGCNPPFQTRNE